MCQFLSKLKMIYSGPWAFCEGMGGEGARDAVWEFGVQSRLMLITQASADSLAQGRDSCSIAVWGFGIPNSPPTHSFIFV